MVAHITPPYGAGIPGEASIFKPEGGKYRRAARAQMDDRAKLTLTAMKRRSDQVRVSARWRRKPLGPRRRSAIGSGIAPYASERKVPRRVFGSLLKLGLPRLKLGLPPLNHRDRSRPGAGMHACIGLIVHPDPP
jgi:hypothetical protein